MLRDDDGDEHAKALEVFQDVEEGPAAESEGDPFEDPLEAPEWCRPNMLNALSSNRPGIGPLSVNSDFHGGEFTGGGSKLKATGKALSTESYIVVEAAKEDAA